MASLHEASFQVGQSLLETVARAGGDAGPAWPPLRPLVTGEVCPPLWPPPRGWVVCTAGSFVGLATGGGSVLA